MSRMKSRRLVVTVGLTLAVSALAVPTQAATKACVGAPSKPSLRAVWATSGGPTFTVAGALGKSAATSVRWTVSFLNPSTMKWSNYSAWKSVPVTTKAKSVLHADPSPSRSLVNMVAVAANACGSSGQQRVMVPLNTASALVAKPTLASAIPLRVKTISYDEIAGAATSGLPLSLTSASPTICAADAARRQLTLMAAGDCRFTISERNAVISLPNPDVDHTITVVGDIAPLSETTRDRVDERVGFQVHVVYVTPRGAQSHGYRAGGQLGLWVDLAQRWIAQRIGRSFAFDTSNGQLDVTSLTSGMTLDEMRARTGAETSGSDELLAALSAEFTAANGRPVPGKNLLFVLDGKLSDGYCGFADRPGSLAIVTAASPGCWTGDDAFIAQKFGLNWMSATIIHELLHNVGVPHMCADNSDIMLGDGCAQPDASEVLTLDSTGGHYLGGAGATLDIRTVKVWADGSGSRHIAVDGICYIGEQCALERTWWSAGDQTLALQRLVQGTWQTLSRFTSRKDATTSPNFPYTYDVTLTPSTAGSYTYRYRLEPTAGWSETLGDPFTVVVPY